MLFNTAYSNRPIYEGEIFDDEIITETAGFLPMKNRIENLMLAGQRLVESRVEQFDFPDGVDDGQEVDPSRVPTTDLAEISIALQKVTRNLETVQKEAAVRASEAKKKVSEPEKVSE